MHSLRIVPPNTNLLQCCVMPILKCPFSTGQPTLIFLILADFKAFFNKKREPENQLSFCRLLNGGALHLFAVHHSLEDPPVGLKVDFQHAA